MNAIPGFPTKLHHDVAYVVRDYFYADHTVDTVLVVNSCARGRAVPESDLDFAILVSPGTTLMEMENLEAAWNNYSETQPNVLNYKRSGPLAHLHLDIIKGDYNPGVIKEGEPIDYFEIEIGNQVCYSWPMDHSGAYFQELQLKWLPYYDEGLRAQRLEMTRKSCKYDLDHIPLLVKRELYFHAFDILWKAFQEYLQVLFITNRTYPLAYNKWIKEQVIEWLNMPELFQKLSPVLSIGNIESNEVNDKASMLRALLRDLPSG